MIIFVTNLTRHDKNKQFKLYYREQHQYLPELVLQVLYLIK